MSREPMEAYTAQNKRAWEHDAYAFWVREAGTPAQRAQEDIENPLRMLRRHARYFDATQGVRIANICGSCGKKAVPLALLGASVTLFDLSEGNLRYARETADAAGVPLETVAGDVLATDMETYGGRFDIVFMEGGILHYFHDLNRFMQVQWRLLRPGGRLILSDFHPLHKLMDVLALGTEAGEGDYFDTRIFESEMAHAKFYDEAVRRQFPKVSLRRYTLSEIINAVLDAGFILRRFDELPAWTDAKLPGEFVMLADKPGQDSTAGNGSA